MDPTFSSSSRTYQINMDKTVNTTTSKDVPTNATTTNNLDELQRIYRNNTLWEVGESIDSRCSKGSKSRSRSPPKIDKVRASRI